MSLTKYELLLAAIEHGSISAAAEVMGYSQSGVSHMLNSLEEELGVKILARSKHGVQLTTVGQTLYPHLKRIVNDNKNFNQEISELLGLIKGKLVIGSIATASACYLPKIIAEFSAMYPNINFELRNGTYPDIERWIENGEVDCGFVSFSTKEKFNIVPVISDKFVAVVKKGSKLDYVSENTVSIDDLFKEKLILICSSDYDMLELFSMANAPLSYKIITDDGFAAIEMVKQGLGIGLMSELIAYNFSEDVDVYYLNPSHARALGLAYPDKKSMSPVTRKFISFLESKGMMIVRSTA